MIIAFYYRVSKRDKQRGISLEVQPEVCERWVKQHSDPAIRDALCLPPYIDDSKSAYNDTIAKRPAFQQLIEDAHARKFDMIVVYKYDRFARKRRVFFNMLDELQENYNIAVKSATESDDFLSVGINGLLSDNFSRMLSARMKDVKQYDTRERGRWVGAVPFGYDRLDGKLVPNADAWIVKLIFDLFVTNRYSMMDLVDELRARDLMRRSAYHNDGEPYPFGQQSIRQILSNRAYIGEARCGDIAVPNAHEAIIDVETFQAAQDIRERRSTHGGRLTIQAPDRGILTGVVRCAICGNAMWYDKSGKGWRSYKCRIHVRYHACDNSPAHVPIVDRYALHILSRLHLPDDWLEQALALVAAQPKQPAPDTTQIERELRKLAEDFVSGRITDPFEYRTREAELKAKREPVLPITTVDLGRAAKQLGNLANLIEHATPDEHRALISTIFERIWLRASVIEAWTPRPAYLPLFTVLYGERLTMESSAGKSR